MIEINEDYSDDPPKVVIDNPRSVGAIQLAVLSDDKAAYVSIQLTDINGAMSDTWLLNSEGLKSLMEQLNICRFQIVGDRMLSEFFV